MFIKRRNILHLPIINWCLHFCILHQINWSQLQRHYWLKMSRKFSIAICTRSSKWNDEKCINKQHAQYFNAFIFIWYWAKSKLGSQDTIGETVSGNILSSGGDFLNYDCLTWLNEEPGVGKITKWENWKEKARKLKLN